jgi:hypothetical protein
MRQAALFSINGFDFEDIKGIGKPRPTSARTGLARIHTMQAWTFLTFSSG